MAKVKCGLIQMGLKGDGSMEPLAIRDKMIEAHIPFIEDAANQGVQVLCFQEVFTQPYFCPSQDRKWYAAAEKVPDGHTTQLMQEYAKKHNMVMVVPVYEEHMTGVYYNTAAVIDADGTFLGKYRKTHIPQVDPGDTGYPVFDTAYVKLGVYICYDRHFPEGWRALALNGAEYIVNPSATVAGLSKYLWELEQPASAAANGVFIGAINRIGSEEPWATTSRHKRATIRTNCWCTRSISTWCGKFATSGSSSATAVLRRTGRSPKTRARQHDEQTLINKQPGGSHVRTPTGQ
jgi:N-carbamoylputrescine amidase